MKNLLFAFAILTSLGAAGQSQVLCLSPSCSRTITTADSAAIYVQIVTTDSIKSVAWSQPTGQSLSLPGAGTVKANGATWNGFMVRALPVGTYYFTASVTGMKSSGQITDTLIVKAACPICPAPRTVTGATITINGVVYPVPVGWLKLNFSDGTTQ